MCNSNYRTEHQLINEDIQYDDMKNRSTLKKRQAQFKKSLEDCHETTTLSKLASIYEFNILIQVRAFCKVWF